MKAPSKRDLLHISRELRPLARAVVRLKVDPRNARTHSKRNIEAIRASLERYGQQKPIVLRPDGKTVAAGSGTLEAAWLLGWTWIAAIRFDRDPEIAAAYGLADNRTAELAGWDEQVLGELLEHYRASEGDGLPGWTETEVRQLLSHETTEDTAPASPAVPVSVSGEVYELGPHRVLCGDSTAPEAVSGFLDVKGDQMLLTDPPYCSGGFQESGRAAGSVGSTTERSKRVVANDTLSTRGYMALLKVVVSNIDADMAYVFTDWRMWVNLFDVMESSGFGVRSMIVWNKLYPGMGQGWRSQHELIMCASKIPVKYNPKLSRGNVIDIPRTGNKHHVTEKPVELLATLLNTTPQMAVIDPFMGSGSTLIAAEQTGRTCYGIELDPRYVDVIRQRYANFVKDAKYSPTGTLDG